MARRNPDSEHASHLHPEAETGHEQDTEHYLAHLARRLADDEHTPDLDASNTDEYAAFTAEDLEELDQGTQNAPVYSDDEHWDDSHIYVPQPAVDQRELETRDMPTVTDQPAGLWGLDEDWSSNGRAHSIASSNAPFPQDQSPYQADHSWRRANEYFPPDGITMMTSPGGETLHEFDYQDLVDQITDIGVNEGVDHRYVSVDNLEQLFLELLDEVVAGWSLKASDIFELVTTDEGQVAETLRQHPAFELQDVSIILHFRSVTLALMLAEYRLFLPQ